MILMNNDSISETQGHRFNKVIQRYTAEEQLNNKEKHKQEAWEREICTRERERGTDGRTDGWMGGRAGGRAAGRSDGQTDRQATRGVTVSMSAFLACHQCYCAGSSLAWGLNLRAVVCGIF